MEVKWCTVLFIHSKFNFPQLGKAIVHGTRAIHQMQRKEGKRSTEKKEKESKKDHTYLMPSLSNLHTLYSTVGNKIPQLCIWISRSLSSTWHICFITNISFIIIINYRFAHYIINGEHHKQHQSFFTKVLY